MPDRTIPADVLERWARDLLVGSGLREDAAATVATTLVAASRRGVDSHGVARVPIYAQRLRAGLVNGDPHPAVVQRHGATELVDGDHGPGQVAGVYATHPRRGPTRCSFPANRRRAQERRDREGIPLSAVLADALVMLSSEVGVTPPG